jgi:cytochrome c oxidase cbb3-type subunit 2
MFALATSMFLIGLIVAGFAMPSGGKLAPMMPVSSEIARGRAIFSGEGCLECHSRLVRIDDRGMGPIASADLLSGETGSVGSSRVGPDLQNVAGRYPRSLLETRLTDPRVLQPDTLMPSYAHLGESDMSALISYLDTPLTGTSAFEAIRSRNGIEAAVPDEMLMKLSEYMDFETGLFVPPIKGMEGELIIGRGIYNSRCAACHGIYGDGSGPASWEQWRTGPSRASRAVPSVPPSDFRSGDAKNYSPVMWYWRISEGVPGTGMPAWDGSLSEDALWFLVGYVTALANGTQPVFPGETPGDVVPVFGEEIEVPEEVNSVVQDEWIFEPVEATDPSGVETDIQDADGASEEEGQVGAPDGGEGANSSGDDSDATESAEDPLIEEETP